MERRDLGDVPGVRFVPAEPTGTGALVLAGSSGRIDADRAHLLAVRGAVAESVQWFGGAGQHDGPWEIPLEFFISRVEDLARDCDRVVVLGTSFGSEAALLTGVHSSAVSAVVGFAPSDVVWTGVTSEGRATSHWSMDGNPLPRVPFVDDWEPTTDPPAFAEFYRLCRDRFPDDVAAASIPVERIPEVLLIAGGDDQVWPSSLHCDAIRARRAAYGLDTTVIVDPEAGHRTVLPGEPVVRGGMRMARGGTDTADRRLGEAAWAHLAALL